MVVAWDLVQVNNRVIRRIAFRIDLVLSVYPPHAANLFDRRLYRLYKFLCGDLFRLGEAVDR
jgi:hypothetical protein